MAEDLAEFVQRSMLLIWRKKVGWRRFFIADWWRLKLNFKTREE